MHTSLWLGTALLPHSLAAILTSSPSAVSTSPSDPTITPGPLLRKQNDARYMGWVSFDGTWTSQRCDADATFFQSGGHWRCCATTGAGCDVPEACVGGNLIYRVSSTALTIPCTSAFTDLTDRSFTVCNTAFLYENALDTSPQTNVNCGVSSLNWSYYRVQPEAAKTTSVGSGTSRSAAATTTARGNTFTPTQPEPEEKSSSKVWIAGVVIGPLLGLALVGILAWCCVRRRKRTHASPTAAPETVQSYAPVPIPGTGPPQYYPPPQQQPQYQHHDATAPELVPASAAAYGGSDGKQTWTPQTQTQQPQTQHFPAPNSPLSPTSPTTPSPGPSPGYTPASYVTPQAWPQSGGNGPGTHYPPPPPPQQQQAYSHPPAEFSSELDGSPKVVGGEGGR